MCGQGDHPPYDDERFVHKPGCIAREVGTPAEAFRDTMGTMCRCWCHPSLPWPGPKGPDHPLRSPWVEKALDGTLPAQTVEPVRKRGAHL